MKDEHKNALDAIFSAQKTADEQAEIARQRQDEELRMFNAQYEQLVAEIIAPTFADLETYLKGQGLRTEIVSKPPSEVPENEPAPAYSERLRIFHKDKGDASVHESFLEVVARPYGQQVQLLLNARGGTSVPARLPKAGGMSVITADVIYEKVQALLREALK